MTGRAPSPPDTHSQGPWGSSASEAGSRSLAHLFERLEPAVAGLPPDSRRDFHIERIRQKFGRLQVRLSEEGTPEMRAAIDEAENASVVTCEVCGAPGSLPIEEAGPP
jgi:hypothetical protein